MLSEATAPSSTTSQNPFSSLPARRRERMGSESKRGKHHHVMRPPTSINAAVRQLPITERSRGLPLGPSTDIGCPQLALWQGTRKDARAFQHNARQAALVLGYRRA